MVYFPLQKPGPSATTGFIVAAWIVAFVLVLPSFFNVYGMNGLECKTRKCTMLIDRNGNDLKRLAGSITLIASVISLIMFNFAIATRLRVRK